nr:cystathionine beta-lyase [Raoultella sp. NCTC 9187]
MFDFSTPVDRHGTWCTQWDYVADRFGTADLLPFTISDMDFATAPCILDAVSQRLATAFLATAAGKTTSSSAPLATGSPAVFRALSRAMPSSTDHR